MNSSKTAQKVEPAHHWIDGEWVGSSTVTKSVSPSTGEVLGQYSAGGRVEAAAAITAARKAFNAGVWSHDPQLRSRALLELADQLDERADAIALTISREEGKTLGQATLEATWSPSTLRYNAGTALSQTGMSAEIAPGVFATAMREPIGVAGIIVPWNSRRHTTTAVRTRAGCSRHGRVPRAENANPCGSAQAGRSKPRTQTS
jgi:acyl-CoA reductase-like NAD-dependent aldehyde dehydrogenase